MDEEQEFVDVFPPPPTFYKLYHPTKSEYIAPEPPKALQKGQTYTSFGEVMIAIVCISELIMIIQSYCCYCG